MSDGTKIEWTDATWNIVNGCSVLSPGCTNCYAMRLAGTRMRHHPSRQGLTVPSKAGPVWNGTVRFNDKVLLDPLKWRRPRRIFVCAHGDLFHEKVPDEWLDRVFAVMALAPQHVFQVLTKRPERMRDYVLAMVGGDRAIIRAMQEFGSQGLDAVSKSLWGEPNNRQPLPNVWLGVSVEDQQRADERIPLLLATPAAVRWLSCEPLLGPVDLRHVQCERHVPEDHEMDWKFDTLMTGSSGEYWDGSHWMDGDGPVRSTKIDWVVAGGESGRGARPMHPDWALSLRDQCAAAGVPFLFKQWGSWEPATGDGDTSHVHQWVIPPESDRFGPINRLTDVLMRCVGKKAAGRLLDGVQYDGFPA